MPQLGELPRLVQALILAAALGLLLYLVVWLYRYELQYVPQALCPRPAGFTTPHCRPHLRGGGLKPTFRHVAREVIPSHVLVAWIAPTAWALPTHNATRSKSWNWPVA